MNLSKNSLTAKLYRWFYNKNTMPANLCPYFWQLVLMWVTIIPFMIFTLPFQLLIRFRKEDLKEKLEMSSLLYGVLLTLFCMVIGVVHLFAPFGGDKTIYVFALFGLLLWGMGLIIGVAFLIMSIKDYLIIKKYTDNLQSESPKQNSVVVEFVKATYNKYCPQIKWD